MILDARSIESGSVLSTDICIVGAGPAGLTLARELDRSGLGIVLVEAGGESFDSETEALLRGVSNAPEGPVRALPYPLHTAQAMGFGGSSLRWCLPEGWRARPLEPIDLEARDGVPYSGWPISYEDLRPYYARAKIFCRLDPEHEDTDYWANQAGEDNLVFDHAGLRSEVFFRVNKSLYSDLKQTFANSDTTIVATHASVVEVETDPEARYVRTVRARTLAGNEFKVVAQSFVLAAGGISNARLLLASNRVTPGGLGNGSDLVGRFFMEHPHVFTGLLSLKRREDAERMTFYDALRTRDGQLVEGVLALSPEMLRRHALPNAGFFVRGMSVRGTAAQLLSDISGIFGSTGSPQELRRRLRNVIDDIGFCADVLIQRGPQRLKSNNLFYLYCESEQVPNPDSRATLDRERDPLGLPRVRLDWKLQTRDFETIRLTEELLDAELRMQGRGRLFRLFGDDTIPPKLGIGNHQMGTTRMSNDPRTGVVDSDGRVHGIANLFVAGSSVFPTGGAANPTLTIIALAIRLGDQLKSLVSKRIQSSVLAEDSLLPVAVTAQEGVAVAELAPVPAAAVPAPGIGDHRGHI